MALSIFMMRSMSDGIEAYFLKEYNACIKGKHVMTSGRMKDHISLTGTSRLSLTEVM
jgi:hypothetical protein